MADLDKIAERHAWRVTNLKALRLAVDACLGTIDALRDDAVDPATTMSHPTVGDHMNLCTARMKLLEAKLYLSETES